MDAINKLLVLSIMVAFCAIGYSTVRITSHLSKTVEKSVDTVEKCVDKLERSVDAVTQTLNQAITHITQSTTHKNLVIPSHPYNECIKLLIDQINHEKKESDLNQIKSVCYELMKDETSKD